MFSNIILECSPTHMYSKQFNQIRHWHSIINILVTDRATF